MSESYEMNIVSALLSSDAKALGVGSKKEFFKFI